MKIGQVRKSKKCLCEKPDGKCFNRVEEYIDGEDVKYIGWVIHCKTTDKMCNEILGKVNKKIRGD